MLAATAVRTSLHHAPPGHPHPRPLPPGDPQPQVRVAARQAGHVPAADPRVRGAQHQLPPRRGSHPCLEQPLDAPPPAQHGGRGRHREEEKRNGLGSRLSLGPDI